MSLQKDPVPWQKGLPQVLAPSTAEHGRRGCQLPGGAGADAGCVIII